MESDIIKNTVAPIKDSKHNISDEVILDTVNKINQTPSSENNTPTDDVIKQTAGLINLKKNYTGLANQTSANSFIYGYNSPFGESKYDKGLKPLAQIDPEHPFKDLEYYRGGEQSAGRKAIYGIGRIMSKTLTEVAKMPGFIYGMGDAIVGSIQDGVSGKNEHSFIEDLTNNAWINTFENLDENIKENLLPVYSTEAAGEGGIWDNITSLSFWAKDGADGIGFILSMLVPGLAIGSVSKNIFSITRLIGKGVKLAEASNEGGALLNLGEKAITAVAKGLNKIGGTSNNINLLNATALSSTLEAAEEARGLIKELRVKLEKEGKYSKEEIDKIVSEQGLKSFWTNIAILSVPNFFANKMLLGRFKSNAGIAGTGAEEIVGKGIKKRLQRILTRSEAFKKGTKEFVFGGFREGFYEEGLQSTTQNYLESPEKYQDKNGVPDFISAYMTMLGTLDGQKSILLGSLFGGIMGGIERAGNVKRTNKEAPDLNRILEDKFSVFASTLTDSYEKDVDGNVIYEEDGITPKKDIIKIKKNLESILDGTSMSKLLTVAEESGDVAAYNLLFSKAFSAMIGPYTQVEGGMERLQEQLTGLKNILVSKNINKNKEGKNITQESYIKDLINKAKEYKSDFELYNDYIGRNIKLGDIGTQGNRISYLNELAHTYAGHKALDRVFNEVIQDLETKKQEINKKVNKKVNNINIESPIEEVLSGINSKIDEKIKEIKTLQDTNTDNIIQLQEADLIKTSYSSKIEADDLFRENVKKAEKEFDEKKAKEEEDRVKAEEVNNINTKNKEEEEKIKQAKEDALDAIISTYNENEDFVIPEGLDHAGEEATFTIIKESKNNTKIKIRTKDGIEFILDSSSLLTKKTKSDDNSTEGSDLEDTNDYTEEVKNIGKRQKPDNIKGRLHTRILSTTDNDALLDGIEPDWVEDYEREPRQKIGDVVTFSLSTKIDLDKFPESIKKEKVIKAVKIYENFNNLSEEEKDEQIKFLYNYLPIKVSTHNRSSFLSTLVVSNNEDAIDAWNNTEKITRVQIINHVLLDGGKFTDLSSIVEFQYPGILTMDKKVDGKIVENNILDLKGITSIKSLKLLNVNRNGNLLQSDGTMTQYEVDPRWAGAIFMEVTRANGSKIPLKLNIRKITKEQAVGIYDILTNVLLEDTINMDNMLSDLSPVVTASIIANLSKELKVLQTSQSKIKIKTLLDILIWQSKNSNARVYIEGDNLVFGNNIVNKEDISDTTKQSFIDFLINNKRQHIKFKLREGEQAIAPTTSSPSYLQYLADEKILNTNAVVNKPLFNGFTYIYINKKISGTVKKEVEVDNEQKVYDTYKDLIEDLIKQSMATIRQYGTSNKGKPEFTADTFDGLGRKNIDINRVPLESSIEYVDENSIKNVKTTLLNYYNLEFPKELFAKYNNEYKAIIGKDKVVSKTKTIIKEAPLNLSEIKGTEEAKKEEESFETVKKANKTKLSKREKIAAEQIKAKKAAEELDKNCKD